MSWNIKQKQRAVLEAETNLCSRGAGRGGQLNVCLVSPSRYHTGMSSLGFQTVYSLLASSPGILCERAFLPDREDLEEYRRSGMSLFSLETRRSLSDFDIIAFSTSFEPDYLNIPLILTLSRIPIWSNERNASHPLIIAGGAAFFINPEPVADFLDLICIGEGEELITNLIDSLMAPGRGRKELLMSLAALPGFYVPSLYKPRYTAGRLVSVDVAAGAPVQIKRACAPLDQHNPSQSVILTDNTEFGDMFLVEVSRGCPRGCRFCTSGFIYAPFRQNRFESLATAVDKGLEHRGKIGLVGAAVSDYGEIGRLCRYIVDKGAKVSVSSLRIDRLDTVMLDALIASGHKTISIAPEGGSQRLRDVIRKNLTEEQILNASDLIISRGILNLKLYFIIGLPTETESDLEEMIRLVTAIRARVLERARSNRRMGEIILSVNPFIPKPFTPFQWCGMEPLASLEKKVKLLENRFRAISNVRLKVEGLRDSCFQALLSRGDRRISKLLAEMAGGMKLGKAAKECGIDINSAVQRIIDEDEVLPWEIIAADDRAHLRGEYEQALIGQMGGANNEKLLYLQKGL